MIVCACFFYTAGINAMYMFAHHQMARPGSWRHSFIDDVCICMSAYCAKIFPNICRHGFQCNQDLVHHQQRHFSCCHGQSLRSRVLRHSRAAEKSQMGWAPWERGNLHSDLEHMRFK